MLRIRIGGVLPTAVGLMALSVFAVSCGADETTGDVGNESSAENADEDHPFPANREVGPMRLHIPEAWEEFPVEDSGEGQITGYSEAQDGPGDRYVMTRTDFQGATTIGSASGILSAEIQLRGGSLEEPEQVEVEGADNAWSADLTWPGADGEVTARYWIAQDEETGVMAATEYGGYDVDADELDQYGQTLELVPEVSQ